ncbi:MAG: GntR family transcriptional regulator [Firmicutes bacterium]|nr:GntR family transcriptional regulator [Bacillota bacterium]
MVEEGINEDRAQTHTKASRRRRQKRAVVDSQSLAEKAYTHLRDMILSGQFQPGVAVSISVMARTLHMSRTPVSVACQRLEKEGLVRVLPKRGVLINSVTFEDARDIYEARTAIETYVIGKVFGTLTEADFNQLAEIIERQRAAVEAGDPYRFMIEDTAFHDFFLRKYGNSLLIEIVDNIRGRVFQAGLRNCCKPQRMQQSLSDHEEILRQLKEGDKQSSMASMEANMVNGYLSWSW